MNQAIFFYIELWTLLHPCRFNMLIPVDSVDSEIHGLVKVQYRVFLGSLNLKNAGLTLLCAGTDPNLSHPQDRPVVPK